MAYTFDDWVEEQKANRKTKGGQGNKGRKPGQSGPPKGDRVKTPDPNPTPTPKTDTKPGKGWQKDGGLLGKGGNVETGDALSTAATLASKIADMSPSKWRGPVDAGTPVQQNEGGKKKGQTSETEYDKNSAMVDPEDEDYRKKKNQYGLD